MTVYSFTFQIATYVSKNILKHVICCRNSILEEELEPPPDSSGGITGEPEPMTEKDLREASTAIDVFGEPLVSREL